MKSEHKPSYRKLRLESLESRIALAADNIGFGAKLQPPVVIDGNNWFIDNANFPTTSSAAGFAEASFTGARAVTTLNGGTIQSTLHDAFDGVMAFGLVKGGNASTTTYFDSDGIVDLSTDSQSNIVITYDPNTEGTDHQSFNGVTIAQQMFFSSTAPMARFLWTINNPTNAPITQTYGEFNNLGSDANTTYVLSSSGGTVPTNSDTWWTSFQNYVGTTSTDPRLLFVDQGPGTVQVPHQFINPIAANGNDNPNDSWTITLDPGQSVSVMAFVGIFASKAAANTEGHVFDNLSTIQSAGLLADLTPTQLASIVNFNANPFQVSGNTLTVTGTSGNDQFSITGGAAQFTADLDGFSQDFDSATITNVIYNFNGGADTTTILGLQGTATANFSATQTTVTGNGYNYTINGSQTVYVFGASGDTATMNDTTSDDLFYGLPSYAVMENAVTNPTTYWNEAIGFGTVNAIASTGNDMAFLYDSAGSDTYTATDTDSKMTGTGYTLDSTGFDAAYGFFFSGGTDTANLAPDEVTTNYVYGTAGDTANLSDSTGNNDTFYGVPTGNYSLLLSQGQVNEVVGFGNIQATSTAGSDTAVLYDTSENDTFTSTGNTSTMVTGAITNAAIGFSTNYAFFIFGGNDTANLHAGTTRNNYVYGDSTDTANFFDSAGADIFYGLSAYSLMDYHGGYLSQAVGFGHVNATATQGTGDEAELNKHTGDVVTINGNSGSLTNSTLHADVEVQHFDAVFEIDS